MDMVKNMFGWKGMDEFVENTQKKKVQIYPNGDFENGKGMKYKFIIYLTSCTNLLYIEILIFLCHLSII